MSGRNGGKLWPVFELSKVPGWGQGGCGAQVPGWGQGGCGAQVPEWGQRGCGAQVPEWGQGGCGAQVLLMMPACGAGAPHE